LQGPRDLGASLGKLSRGYPFRTNLLIRELPPEIVLNRPSADYNVTERISHSAASRRVRAANADHQSKLDPWKAGTKANLLQSAAATFPMFGMFTRTTLCVPDHAGGSKRLSPLGALPYIWFHRCQTKCPTALASRRQGHMDGDLEIASISRWERVSSAERGAGHRRGQHRQDTSILAVGRSLRLVDIRSLSLSISRYQSQCPSIALRICVRTYVQPA